MLDAGPPLNSVRAPQRRASDGWALRQTGVWAAAVSTLMLIGEANAKEPVEKKPSNEPVPGAVIPTEKEKDELLGGLASGFFDERQGASQRIEELLWRAFDEEALDPEAVLQRLTSDTLGRPRQLDSEQRYRLRALAGHISEWKKLPATLPVKGTVSGNDALGLLQEDAKLPIVADRKITEELASMRMDLSKRRESRIHASVMGSLCQKARVKPVLQPDGGLKLEPLATGERIVWSQDLLGVLSPAKEDKPAELTLQCAPGQGVILGFLDKKGNFSRDAYCIKGTQMPLPPEAEEEAPHDGPRDGIPNIRLAASRNRHHEPYSPPISEADYNTIQMFDSAQAGVVVARAPSSVELRPEGEGQKIGEQMLMMEKPFQLRDTGKWVVFLQGTTYGSTVWNDVPPMFDRLTYKLPHTNRYEFRDANGKQIPHAVTDIYFARREMSIRIDCESEPVLMTLHGFGEVREEWLHMPELPSTSYKKSAVTPPEPPATR